MESIAEELKEIDDEGQAFDYENANSHNSTKVINHKTSENKLNK